MIYRTYATANGAGLFSVVLPADFMNNGVSYGLQAHQYIGGTANSSEIGPVWGVWLPAMRR